jgi:hypothetical protein
MPALAVRLSHVAVPPLLAHIPRIVGLRAEKQVKRIYTARIIATVANAEPVRDWPKMKLPRKAMGLFVLVSSDAKNAVLCRISCGSPFPTRFIIDRWRDPFPEAAF